MTIEEELKIGKSKLFRVLEQLTGDLDWGVGPPIPLDDLMTFDVRVYAASTIRPCKIEKVYVDLEDRTINVDVS